MNKIIWKGETRWVSVESHPLGDTNVVVRTASSLTSSDWQTSAYTFDLAIADPDGVADARFWSAYAHPEMSFTSNTSFPLLISYWSHLKSQLRFVNFPLQRLKPWCTQLGVVCWN